MQTTESPHGMAGQCVRMLFDPKDNKHVNNFNVIIAELQCYNHSITLTRRCCLKPCQIMGKFFVYNQNLTVKRCSLFHWHHNLPKTVLFSLDLDTNRSCMIRSIYIGASVVWVAIRELQLVSFLYSSRKSKWRMYYNR